MDKTLEELRAETERYLAKIKETCEKINYDINCINTNLRMAKDIMKDSQLEPEVTEREEVI